MKKLFLPVFAVLPVFCHLPAAAMDEREVQAEWENTVISVTRDNRVPEDIALLRAFNKTWQVPAISAYLKKWKTSGKNTGKSAGRTLTIRGYDDCDEDSCTVFVRENPVQDDHALFFVIFGRVSDIVYTENLLVYDYDRNSGAMKPLPDFPARNHSTGLRTSGLDYQVYSFDDGDSSLVISDGVTDGPLVGARSLFRQEGASLRYEGAEITVNGASMKEQLAALDAGEFAFYDIDGDGNTELFLKNSAVGCILALSVAGRPETRTAEFIDFSENGAFIFYEKGLSQERNCGPGCFSGSYVLMENSAPAAMLSVYELTPLPGKKVNPEESPVYKILGPEGRERRVTAAEKEEFIKKMGKKGSDELTWQPLLGIRAEFPEDGE